jgi:hypothetical protein
MIYKNFKQITEYCRKNYIVDKQYNLCFDIGSTLNSYLVGNNRGYLKGAETLKKTCIW